jgi:hypothetical protein
MDDSTIWQLFSVLWSDIRQEDEFFNKKPLLAHYSSIQVIENILKNDEVWFSNPLFMNDLEEVRFGIFQGVPLVLNSYQIANALQNKERFDIFFQHFNNYHNQFVYEHVVDNYVFCLAEHDRTDFDGALSMWRGYGNNGNGAAIVFDTSKITVVNQPLLIISKVIYSTVNERISWLNDLMLKFAGILSNAYIPNDKLWLPAFYLFERIKLFSLFTKHNGFKEEREWRIAYMKERDIRSVIEPMIDYFIGPRGIEPKLKLKTKSIDGFISDSNAGLSQLVDRIILGPTTSSPMARATLFKMLDKIGKSELREKIYTSTIPFRST